MGWLAVAGAQAAAPVHGPSVQAVDFRGASASPDVRRLARFAVVDGDAAGKAFAVVDKQRARIFVFEAGGRLVGTAPALLGQATGDRSAPGVAKLVTSHIPKALRTTPAGRFDSEPGHNLDGEAIVWVAYEAAVAIHRLRDAPASQRRPQRLASATPADNRISLGCIVVADRFYDTVVAPTLGQRPGVVYVLPDTQNVAETFRFGAADL